MSRTLVVHSGTFKTGSSSIQRFLLGHAELLARYGVTYPSAGRPPTVAQHSNLVAQLKGWQSFSPSEGGLDAVLDDLVNGPNERCVVSSESFSTLTREEMGEFSRCCADRGVRVMWVHYVREQSSFINAFYVERLMVMRPEFAELVQRPFADFLDWSPVAMDFLYYTRFVRQILDTVSDVELRVRPFVRSELVEGDVVQDFLTTIGIEADVGEIKSTNIGAGWRTTELARYLTPHLGHAHIERRVSDAENSVTARLRSFALVRRELLAATTAAGWNEESAVYCTPELRKQFRARFASDNEQLGELVGFDWPTMVQESPDKPYNAGTLDQIPTSDLLEVLDAVLPAVIDPPLP